MIKKEMKRIIQMEKYISSLTKNQMENNLLREDFYVYDQIQKNRQPLFDGSKRPQDNIFSLIEDCEVGSFEQLEQLESRINYMLALQQNIDTIVKLKHKYCCERKMIVDSGLTIAQIMEMYGKIGDTSQKDPYCIIIRDYFENKGVKNKFVWQFLDEIFNTIDNEEDSNKKWQNNEVNKNIVDFGQNKQKNLEIHDMFKKLAILLKPNYQQMQKQILKNQKASKN